MSQIQTYTPYKCGSHNMNIEQLLFTKQEGEEYEVRAKRSVLMKTNKEEGKDLNKALLDTGKFVEVGPYVIRLGAIQDVNTETHTILLDGERLPVVKEDYAFLLADNWEGQKKNS